MSGAGCRVPPRGNRLIEGGTIVKKLLLGFAVVALLLVPGTASAGGRIPTGTISAPSPMIAGQSYLVTATPGYTPKNSTLYIDWICPGVPGAFDQYPITLADPSALVLANGTPPNTCTVYYEVHVNHGTTTYPWFEQFYVAQQDVSLTSG
jgi:hypothetical protein